MQLKHITAGALLLASFALVGCSTQNTPKCSDQETVDLVIEIAKEELEKGGMGSLIPELEFDVKNIRTTEHNKDVDSYRCAADFEMSGGAGTEDFPIEYSVESTDDGESFYVNVWGF